MDSITRWIWKRRFCKICAAIVLFSAMFSLWSKTMAQISEYDKFVSELRHYVETHVADLDPIEGFWVGTATRGTDSPYARTDDKHRVEWIVLKGGGNEWIDVVPAGEAGEFFESIGVENLRFRRIGETDNYKWEMLSSSGIVTIKSLFDMNVRFHFNSTDAKIVAQNPRFSYSVWVDLKITKDYPTYSMYKDAYMNAERQRQKSSEANRDKAGTGFALKNGYVVTNYHVISGAGNITVKGVKGNFNQFYKATVVGMDRHNDLALLKITDPSFAGFGIVPYAISSTTSEVGEEIFVLGYPLTSTMGDEIKLTTGVISSKTGFQDEVSLYQISAPIQPGNSGGPLFDRKGNVVGIVNAKHSGAENVGYAIKSMYLRNLIESSANSAIIPANNTVSTLPLTEKVKMEKNFVFQIHCSGSGATRIIENPGYRSLGDNNLLVKKITLTPTETILECSCTNPLYGGWMNINRGAYILVQGTKYTLTKTEGIAYAPNYTYFDYVNQTKKFKLYFPGIPTEAESLDFIEDMNSAWRIYGISLK
ncbi:MAG: serine protease [Bacteroides sp.]|nr:serine protease [Bacteroides sp.]MCM1086022.1 serine protease [Bacteroides sp.]